MRCTFCDNETIETKKSKLVEENKRLLIIKDIPVRYCPKCGEIYYNGVTLETMEKIIEKWKYNELELSVVNYGAA